MFGSLIWLDERVRLLSVSKVATYHVRIKDDFHGLLSEMLLLVLVRVEVLPITFIA